MAITTGKVRASYVNIFQQRVPENGGEAKYSLTLLIPKTDVATLNAIYAGIESAKREGTQKVFNGAVPPMCRIPLHDGDGFRPSGEAFGEECRGHMVMTASAKLQPSIVGLDMQAILNPADVYSGCYVRANINFFAYSTNGNKGIGCGLNAVQKIGDGEPLTARVSAEEAFGGINAYTGTDGAPVPPYAQPGQAYVPQQAPPVYAQGVQPYMPQQAPPVYGQQGQPYGYPPQGQQTDPITGRPLLNGGVMGIG